MGNAALWQCLCSAGQGAGVLCWQQNWAEELAAPALEHCHEHSRAVPVPGPMAALGSRDSRDSSLAPSHAWHPMPGIWTPIKEHLWALLKQQGVRMVLGVPQQFQKVFRTPYFN